MWFCLFFFFIITNLFERPKPTVRITLRAHNALAACCQQSKKRNSNTELNVLCRFLMYACMYVCMFNGRGSSANFVVCYLKIDKTVSSVYVTYLKRHRLFYVK